MQQTPTKAALLGSTLLARSGTLWARESWKGRTYKRSYQKYETTHTQKEEEEANCFVRADWQLRRQLLVINVVKMTYFLFHLTGLRGNRENAPGQFWTVRRMFISPITVSLVFVSLYL
jgi:hypothetical protein